MNGEPDPTRATAVLISGQTRTFKHCFPNQKWNVFRKLTNPHFFVSVTDDLDAPAIEVLRNNYPVVFIEKTVQPDLSADDEARFKAASYRAGYGISVPVIGIYRQFWQLARVWQMFEANRGPTVIYDNFVRIRPDLHFHYFTPPTVTMRHLNDNVVFAPWWGSWGGIPDRFAFIQGETAASYYFNVFSQIDVLLSKGCPFHPETMLGAALEQAAIPVKQILNAEFTTIRVKGDKRPHDAPSYNLRDIMVYVNARFAEAGL